MGPTNNTGSRHVQSKDYELGHWYLNEEGHLYIVPNAVAEIEGMDDDTLEQLNAVYRENEFDQVDTNSVCSKLNLELVPDVFKRFCPTIGYHCA